MVRQKKKKVLGQWNPFLLALCINTVFQHHLFLSLENQNGFWDTWTATEYDKMSEFPSHTANLQVQKEAQVPDSTEKSQIARNLPE